MELIEINTLVDITNSNISRFKQGKEKEYSQYRNWITLLQCVGLRSIIEYDGDPINAEIDIKDLKFGKKYKGKHKVWTFKFRTDRAGVYKTENEDFDLLINDLHQVPIIKSLDETINIAKDVFDLKDKDFCNTTISLRQIPEEHDVETNVGGN